MGTDQACQEAGARIEQLLKDDAITTSDRLEQIKHLINQYTNAGRDDVVDHLLAVAFRKSGGVYEIIADCIEADLERGRIVLSDGLIAEGEINVLPMIIGHREELPVQADWVHALPPLPDGRRIPGLNDLLLTWDDLTLARERVRELHQLLASGSREKRLPGLLRWRASNAQTGRFDRLWVDGYGRDSSLRFLVAYRLQDEAPWFAGPEQMQQWAASASRQVYREIGISVDIKAPRRLTHGLYVGHGQAEQMIIRGQLADIQRQGVTPNDTSVLIELFGDQYTGVALLARITMTKINTDTLLSRQLFRFGLKSIEGRAQHEMLGLREHCLKEGFAEVGLARLVQPIERIEVTPEVRFLHVVLGPTAAFKEAPEGLPLESAIDPSAEFAKWWDYEHNVASLAINLTRSALAASLEMEEEMLRCKAAFVVEDRKWYQSVVVDLTDARDRIPEWPLNETVINSAISFLAYTEARKWIRCVAVPSTLKNEDAVVRQGNASHENNSPPREAVGPWRHAVVSGEQKFLFQSDLARFWEIVTNDDSMARFAALETLDDLLLVEVIRYGVFNKQEMIGPLASLYRGPIMQMSEDRRFAVYRHVVGFVEHTSTVSVNSFLPFIAEDNARRLVSTAVIDYVSLGQPSSGDPMSRVKDIVGMIESNMLENEGAAFGALLHVGDRRVCDLLVPLRDSLDRDAMSNAVNSGAGFIHSATANFYLDWLEGMEGSDHDDAFGIVASGLGLLKRKSRIDQVCTGNRPFPARNATPEQWKASQRPIPLAEYVQCISRRMYALERAEPPPRVMPHILREWGLKPLTDPAEAAVLDDRAATTTASS